MVALNAGQDPHNSGQNCHNSGHGCLLSGVLLTTKYGNIFYGGSLMYSGGVQY
jgi:hypothetical protein